MSEFTFVPYDNSGGRLTFTAVALTKGVCFAPKGSHGDPQTFTASLPPGLNINSSAGGICGVFALAVDTPLPAVDADVPFIRPSGSNNNMAPDSPDSPRNPEPDASEPSGEAGPDGSVR